MVDRVSTYWTYQGAINNMTQLQANLNKTAEQIATGTELLTPADDPVGAARVMELEEEISLLDQYERNIVLAESRLQQEEAVLTNVIEVLQRMRELTVQAGNEAVYSQTELDAIAAEMEQLQGQVFDLVNATDGSGEYLFSGFQGKTQPFIENAGGSFEYQGDEGVRYMQISQTITVASSDSGKSVFQDITSNVVAFSSYAVEGNLGNPPGVISQGITVDQEALDEFYPHDLVITFENERDVDPEGANFTVRRKSDGRVVEGFENVLYQPGTEVTVAGMTVSLTGSPKPGDQFVVQTSETQDVLTVMEKSIYALRQYGTDPEFSEAYDKAIFNTLENLDYAIENISTVRSEIGARLNTTENMRDQHADNKLAAQGLLAEIRDLDYAEAVSRLQFEEYILQATQQTFAVTSQLSLFDFIR